jgi:alanine-synthesizing transaminase
MYRQQVPSVPPGLSRRTAFDEQPNPLALALERAHEEERRGGRSVLDLTVANPTTAGLAYDREAILTALADPRALVYEPLPFGLPSARAAVAEDHAARGFTVRPEQVLLTASTSEAYSFLFKLLCDPGDELLAPAPSYPLFEHLARFESVKLVPYPLRYDGAWHLDVGEVRARVTERTRGILLVSPNNPTGSYTKKGELAALAQLGVPLVSDEVFAGYPLGPDRDHDRAWSALETKDALVFALGGLSKAAALPQMKLAWTVVQGPPDLTRPVLARLELIADSFLSAGTPVQHALPALLEAGRLTEATIRARTRENLATLDERLARPGSPVSRLHLEGGWYATLRLPRTQSEAAWSLRFLEADGVHVHPGHFFDFEDEAYAIVSLLTPPEVFAEGVRRLAHRVERES